MFRLLYTRLSKKESKMKVRTSDIENLLNDIFDILEDMDGCLFSLQQFRIPDGDLYEIGKETQELGYCVNNIYNKIQSFKDSK